MLPRVNLIYVWIFIWPRSRLKKSVFSALATGAKARLCMSAIIKYTDESIGRVAGVPDFLQNPEELAFGDEGVNVTLALSKRSVDFFKSEASKHHTQYQRMIRRLLDSYVETKEDISARRSK